MRRKVPAIDNVIRVLTDEILLNLPRSLKEGAGIVDGATMQICLAEVVVGDGQVVRERRHVGPFADESLLPPPSLFVSLQRHGPRPHFGVDPTDSKIAGGDLS